MKRRPFRAVRGEAAGAARVGSGGKCISAEDIAAKVATIEPYVLEGDAQTRMSVLVSWPPLVMLGFGCGLAHYGQWLARDEQDFILEFQACGWWVRCLAKLAAMQVAAAGPSSSGTPKHSR